LLNPEESDKLLARTYANSDATQEELDLCALLMQQSRSGHLCIELDDDVQIKNPYIHQFATLLYFQKNWEIETRIVEELKRLITCPKQEVEEASKAASLTEEQASAVKQALSHSLSLITGGPGTGKSYTAAQIVRTLLESSPTACIFIGAPTGKAAANLERSLKNQGAWGLNLQFGTLHKFLGIDPFSPLEEREKRIEDLILIDEASMIDARLFAELLPSVRSEAHLVLMGDAEQLPPVESGNIFADMVESKLIPLTRLTKSLRTDSQELLSLATAIQQGDVEEACIKLKIHSLIGSWWEMIEGKLFFPQKGEPHETALFAIMDQLRILSCVRTGPLGVNLINMEIEARLLEKMEEGQFLALPIIICKNHPATQLYNGDTGILIRHAKEGLTDKDYALFKGRAPLPLFALPSYELGYCISVHKSQGSEYDEVLLLVPEGSEVFGKELLYTAVTRAKKRFAIQGEEKLLRVMLASKGKKRSGVVQRLENCKTPIQ